MKSFWEKVNAWREGEKIEYNQKHCCWIRDWHWDVSPWKMKNEVVRVVEDILDRMWVVEKTVDLLSLQVLYKLLFVAQLKLS